MGKLIVSMHVTLDGFVAGPNGEMDWIKLDDELFGLVGTFTDNADTALYGRITYQMMDNYWPTAADKPNASKHDREHSAWYNKVDKVVLSKSMKGKDTSKTRFISENIASEIENLKRNTTRNILIFGSPSVAHLLMHDNLIDEYWLFINPVILGKGIPMFSNTTEKINLKLTTEKAFPCGVIGLNYTVIK
jgi:dihydrofolate reductase